MNEREETSGPEQDFARLGGGKRGSFWSDYFYFLRVRKKWWMLPLTLALLGYGAMMVLSATGAAPFIYALF